MKYDELAFLEADLNSIQRLMGRLPKDSPTRRSLGHRKTQTLEEMGSLHEAVLGVFGHMKVAFEGPPVYGVSQGITPLFLGEALVATANLVNRLGKSESFGTVPHSSQLVVSDLVRSSFGFALDEIDPQSRIDPSPTHHLLERTADLLVGAIEDESDSEEVGELNHNVLVALREFLKVLDDGGVLLKIETSSVSKVFDHAQVALAYSRYKDTDVADDIINVSGMLTVIPKSGKFELFTIEGKDISGKLADSMNLKQRTEHYSSLSFKAVDAKIQVVTVTHGSRSRKYHKLLSAELSESVVTSIEVNRTEET